MSSSIPDPTSLRELFSTNEFKSSIADMNAEAALALYYEKMHPEARRLEDVKGLKDAEVEKILDGLFSEKLTLLYIKLQKGYFQIGLEPLFRHTGRGRFTATLYHNGELGIEQNSDYPPREFVDVNIPTILKKKSEIRKQILSLGYIPSES